MLRNYVREDSGSVTLEAAYLVPIVICLLCVLLLGILVAYKAAKTEFTELEAQRESKTVREPAAVIRNTDLVLEYLEKLKNALEGSS